MSSIFLSRFIILGVRKLRHLLVDLQKPATLSPQGREGGGERESFTAVFLRKENVCQTREKVGKALATKKSAGSLYSSLKGGDALFAQIRLGFRVSFTTCARGGVGEIIYKL